MKKINYPKLKEANNKSLQGLWDILPILLGILILISVLMTLIPKSVYGQIFTGNLFFDPIIGSVLGSLLTGNPITAYILGNGFLKAGISLIAVTAFMVSWTTVGIIQFPAESLIMGKRFAIFRNISAFLIAIIVAIFTVFLLSII